MYSQQQQQQAPPAFNQYNAQQSPYHQQQHGYSGVRNNIASLAPSWYSMWPYKILNEIIVRIYFNPYTYRNNHYQSLLLFSSYSNDISEGEYLFISMRTDPYSPTKILSIIHFFDILSLTVLKAKKLIY